jgi:uncharacterized repeat protein (TIGR02543 family)
MKTKVAVVSIVLLLLLVTMLRASAMPAEIETVRLYPVEDTYVSSLWPDQAHDELGIDVRSERSFGMLNNRAYLKFDLGGIDCDRVGSVALFLCCYAGWPKSALNIDACQSGDDYRNTVVPWKETGLTWNSAPEVGSVVATTPVTFLSNDQWCNWTGEDLRNYVKQECANDGIATIVLKLSVENCTLCCSRGRSFYSEEFYYNNPYLEITLKPSIESCDSSGIKKDLFNWREIVYANGTGYLPSSTYSLFVVDDVATWVDGMNIPASVATAQVSSDASGNVASTTVWTNPLTAGKYDIIVDVNRNGKYDDDIDALDDNDIMDTAGFVVVKPQYQLTIEVIGSGTTDPMPGSYLYDEDTVVTLTASPTLGWSFIGWSGDASGVNQSIIISMTSNKSVIATFAPDEYTLAVTIVGSGSVIKNPDQATYLYNTVVTLTAEPAPGWSFAGWSGDALGADLTTNVTMTDNKAATATFTQNQYTLTVMTVGQGSAARSPDQATYTYGTNVSVEAFPDPGWKLDHWLLDAVDVGSINPYVVTMYDNHVLTAVFVETPPATVESCNFCGTRKDLFKPRETVCCSGSGYSPFGTYNLYIVKDVSSWNNGMTIPVPVVTAEVSSDASGRLRPTTVWTHPLTPGKYDIIVDVDGNGIYDAGIDALDDNDVAVTGGFLVMRYCWHVHFN